MQLSGPSFDSLLIAVRNGDRKAFNQHFGACLGTDFLPVFRYGARMARAVIIQKISDAAGSADTERNAAIEPQYRRLLYPYAVFRKFTEGRDIVHDLEQLADMFEYKVVDSDYDAVIMAGALAVFCLRRDLVRRLGNMRSFESDMSFFDREIYKNCFEGFAAFLDGKTDPKSITKLANVAHFPGAPGTIQRHFEKFHLTHLRLPALELFAIAASANERRNIWESVDACTESAIRLGKMLSGFEHSADTSACAEIASFLDHFGRNDNLAKTPDAFINGPSGQPLSYLNYSLSAFDAERGGAIPEGNLQAYCDCAQGALSAGLPVLGGTIAGVLKVSPEYLARAEELIAKSVTAGFKPLLFATPKRPEWENALDEIEKFLAGTGDATEDSETVKKETLYWQLNICATDGYEDIFSVLLIDARLRRPTKSGKLSKGKTVDIDYVVNHDSDVELTPEDEKTLALYRSAIGKYRFSYGNDDHFTQRVLKSLAGNPHVCVELRTDDGDVVEDIELSTYPPALETRRTEQGELVLSVPPELAEDVLDKYANVCIRKIDDTHYEVPVADEKTRNAAEIILAHGDGRHLVIPAEAAGKVAEQLVTFAQKLPVQGVISKDGDSATFPRVTTDPTPHARVAMDADDAVKIELRVVVDNEKGGHIMAPGFGSAEMTSRHDGAPVMLVRDLAAEEERAQPVRDMLKKCKGVEALGVDDWIILNLSDALEVLDSLRQLGDNIVIDWLDPDKAVSFAGVSFVAIDAKPKGLDHWFGISGKCELNDGRILAFEEMLKALPSRIGNYVKLDSGDYIRVTGRLRDKLELLESAGEIKGGELTLCDAALPALADAIEASADSENQIVGDEGDDSGTEFSFSEFLLKRADEIRKELAREVNIPAALNATLRPYQVEGFVWLDHLAACGIGACLADDMGLGKTVEIISVLLERAAGGASLVIAPTSVCGNWESEIRRFAPILNPIPLSQCADPRTAISAAGAFDVVIASYGLAVTRNSTLSGRAWNGVVLDEAQAIKNHVAKRAHAVKKLISNFRIAATGTPVENRLSEFWSLFDFLNPGMLLSQEKFVKRYTYDGMATPKLKKLVSPLILRRLKTDVLKDLPEKTEINLQVELGQEEREAYEACRRHAMEKIENLDGKRPGPAGMVVLAELTRLRRFCCHPSLVLPEVTESAKLNALAELLEDLHEGGHRALVFSQYVDYLAIVRNMVETHGWTYKYLDGATPSDERKERVDAFQNGEGDFFLISLKAGGFGLNLTAANYVILLDPWWNPAVENQAADRVHRIGQKLPVTVYRLVAKDTIEERVVALHNDKLKIADDLLEGTSSTALTTEEMVGLFK